MEEDGGEGGGHTKYSPCVYLASEGGGGGRWRGGEDTQYLVEQYTKCFEGLVSVDK